MRLPTTAVIRPGPPIPPVIVIVSAILLALILWGRRRLLPLLLLGLLCLVGLRVNLRRRSRRCVRPGSLRNRRQADTGRQAVEHGQASSQTSKQTYSQTLTDAHGHVDKHKHNHATMSWNTHNLKAAAWQPWGKTSTGIECDGQGQQHSQVRAFNITWCKAGAGGQAGRLAGRPAGRLTCRRLCCVR